MMATRTLTRPPRMPALYARAMAARIPGSSLLGFVGGKHDQIPELRLQLEGVRVNPEKLVAYESVCGFTPGEDLPATYPHVLAFPLHMMVLTDRRFPFPAIGVVHIENRILQHRPIPSGEQLDLSVRATAGGAHPRGTAFALITAASIAGEKVWESASTMLHRAASAAPAGARSDASEAESDPFAETGAASISSWALGDDLGRRYGAVSGDRNPIHMHALSARALGFSGAIAHGMWSNARILAALAEKLPDAYGVQVAFRKPILLPATVELASVSSREEEIEFAIRDATRHTPHLHGRTWPLGAQDTIAAARANPADRRKQA